MVRRKTTLIFIVSATLFIALLLKYDFGLFFTTANYDNNAAGADDDQPATTADNNARFRNSPPLPAFVIGNWKLVKSARSIASVSIGLAAGANDVNDDDLLATRNKVLSVSPPPTIATIRPKNNTTSSIVTFTLHHVDFPWTNATSTYQNTSDEKISGRKYRTCNEPKQNSEMDEFFPSSAHHNASALLSDAPLLDGSNMMISNLVNEDKLTIDYDAETPPESSSALFSEWSPDFAVDPLEPRGERVLNPYPFRFLIEEPDACCRALEQYKPKDGRFKAVILVHTHPEAVENRQLIRETWATPRWQKRFVMLTLFVMGRSENDTVQEALWRESELRHDIVQSSFIASYQNNTYNTMSALKWATSNCHEQTHFIVKTDDDFVINIFRFNIYLTGILNKRGFAQSRHDMFVRCASLFRKARPIRDKQSKWYVSKQLWSHNSYPSICLGGAVMFTPASAEKLYDEAHYYDFFPLDDVFLTGIVAQNITDFKLIHMPGPNGWVMCQSEPKCLIKNRVMFYHTMQARSVMRQFWGFLESQYERKLALLGFQ